MKNIEDPYLSQYKEASDVVVGSMILMVIVIAGFLTFKENIFLSLAMNMIGIFIGAIYSRRKYQNWSSFVELNFAESKKHRSFTQYLLSSVYLVAIWLVLKTIDKYLGLGIAERLSEIMIGSVLGFFMWGFWLRSQLGKA